MLNYYRLVLSSDNKKAVALTYCKCKHGKGCKLWFKEMETCTILSKVASKGAVCSLQFILRNEVHSGIHPHEPVQSALKLKQDINFSSPLSEIWETPNKHIREADDE